MKGIFKANNVQLAVVMKSIYLFFFQHLRETYPQPRESDLSPTLLTFMYNVALAQAQECILEKSMTGNRKPTIIGMALPFDSALLWC